MNRKKTALVLILTLQTLALVWYTILTVKNEGLNFLQVAVENIASFTWSGQFNLDFACYLLLSGIWILWRNQFKSTSIFLALAAMIIGIMVFAPYVVYLIFKEKGNLNKVILGTN